MKTLEHKLSELIVQIAVSKNKKKTRQRRINWYETNKRVCDNKSLSNRCPWGFFRIIARAEKIPMRFIANNCAFHS